MMVKDVINSLKEFDENREVLVDVEGDFCTIQSIEVEDEKDDYSGIVIYINL